MRVEYVTLLMRERKRAQESFEKGKPQRIQERISKGKAQWLELIISRGIKIWMTV